MEDRQVTEHNNIQLPFLRRTLHNAPCIHLAVLVSQAFGRANLYFASAPSKKAISSSLSWRHMISVTINFAVWLLIPGMRRSCWTLSTSSGCCSTQSAAAKMQWRKAPVLEAAKSRRRRATCPFPMRGFERSGTAEAPRARLFAGTTAFAPPIYMRSRLEVEISKPSSTNISTILTPTRGTSLACLSVVKGVVWFSMCFAAMNMPYRALSPGGSS